MPLLAATSSATDFLDLHQSVKFVAGAYIVVLAVILTYVVVMAVRLTRNQRELADLRRLVEERDAAGGAVFRRRRARQHITHIPSRDRPKDRCFATRRLVNTSLQRRDCAIVRQRNIKRREVEQADPVSAERDSEPRLAGWLRQFQTRASCDGRGEFCP